MRADKTGTLTEGKLKLSSTALVPGAAAAAAGLLQPSSNGNGAPAAAAGGTADADAAELLLLRLAAAVEASTRHPLAAALAAEAAARGIKIPPVSEARTEPGAGEGRQIRNKPAAACLAQPCLSAAACSCAHYVTVGYSVARTQLGAAAWSYNTHNSCFFHSCCHTSHCCRTPLLLHVTLQVSLLQ